MLHKQKRGITCVVELKIAGEERSNQHAPITAMPNDTSDMQVSNMEPNRTSSRLQQGKRKKNGEARSAGQRERDLFADVDNDQKDLHVPDTPTESPSCAGSISGAHHTCSVSLFSQVPTSRSLLIFQASREYIVST